MFRLNGEGEAIRKGRRFLKKTGGFSEQKSQDTIIFGSEDEKIRDLRA